MAEICPICSLPTALCVCQQIAIEQEKILISTVSRRYGKKVTIIDGIKSETVLRDIIRTLKTKCATGGTIKNGVIELQGDQKEKVTKILKELGFIAVKCV